MNGYTWGLFVLVGFDFSFSFIRVSLLNLNLKMHRWSQDHEWEQTIQNSDLGWMQLAEPVMQSYTDATDGSCIEKKESAIVWQYSDADPSFGYSQAKEMLDHLESVLSHEPVAVKSGRSIVEVKPQACIIFQFAFLLL